MADDKEKKSQGEEKPKRSRAGGTRKAASEQKPARAKAKPKADEKSKAAPKATKKAEKPKARETTTRRRTTTRAKKDDAPKAEAKAPEESAAKETPKPKAPARRAAPKREAARPAPVRPVVTARAKYVRSSARKARLVIDHVRGKPIGEARALLRHHPRGVARDLERLLNSAVANAENNHDLVGDDLYVKEIYADEGPTLKRFRARAQGRAYRIRKRTSHLTVALTPKE
jgi:ribosomal protein L22